MMPRAWFALAVGLAAASPLAAQSIRIAERVEDLEARARQDSLDPAAHYNLAVGYMSREQFDRADSAFQAAVSIDPQFALAYFALGLVQDRNERYWERLHRGPQGDSAVAQELRRRRGFERKALLIDPFVDVRLLGGVIRHGVIFGARRALVNLAEGDYVSAYGGFEDVAHSYLGRGGLDSIPSGLLWWHCLAAARSAHVPEAIADAEALLRLSLHAERTDSTHVVPLATNEFRYMLAALHQRAGENEAAVRMYHEVLENDIGNYMAHVQLARLFEAGHNWDEAIRERRAAVEANPEDHTLVYDAGVALARAGRWSEAEETLLHAREMKPSFPRTYHVLGLVEQRLGKRDEARAALTRFLEIAPSRYTTQIADARQRLAQLQAAGNGP